MLEITVPGKEFWDETNEEFIIIKERTLRLEHSLVSLSKWEAIWCKPFLDNKAKTTEEMIDYIKCMTITQNVDPLVYSNFTDENIRQVFAYIDAPMTATTITQSKTGKPNREIVTSELIYYWMIAFNIPFEYQKWHLNRLLTLIKVCDVKNTPPKKMSQREIMSRNAEINAQRKKQMNTKG